MWSLSTIRSSIVCTSKLKVLDNIPSNALLHSEKPLLESNSMDTDEKSKGGDEEDEEDDDDEEEEQDEVRE